MSRIGVPFSQFVLKVHSRCDLACDHCYVYEGADEGWRRQPRTMSDETIAWTAQRVAEHAKAHELPAVQVILHGGEPLLAGRARLRRIAESLRDALTGVCPLDLRIHTNGVLLDEQFCDLFAEVGILVGISVDGDRTANDRHRRFANGRSSYSQVLRAIKLLRNDRYRQLYSGLLCTIDVANNPIAVYEALVDLEPPRVDFLLPHATWADPPARRGGSATAYADWLITIFDRWLADGRPMGVRTFDSIIATGAGRDSLTEALGLGVSDLVVVETDGHYEQVDSLKIAYDGAPATGFDVVTHSLDTVARHPGVLARQEGLAGLCDTCQACPVVSSCGGGLYTHRYHPESGFANPSVYCTDLLKLINHVHSMTQHPSDWPRLELPAADFRALAAGYGGTIAIRHLAEAQGGMQRMLVAGAHTMAQKAGLPASIAGQLREAWHVIEATDEDYGDALSTVLGQAYVRAWASDCVRRLRAGEHAGPLAGFLLADMGHLGAVAAATAIRAGLAANVAVPVHEGAVCFPTLGRLILDDQAPTGSGRPSDVAGVEITPASVLVRYQGCQQELPREGILAPAPGPGIPPPGWQPVRTLTAPGISVTLEDTDPYRDCHQWKAAPRLSDQDFAVWQGQFGDAWAAIQQDHDAYAEGLAEGLHTITPLLSGPAGRDVSATARNAFGAIAVALPADHVVLALLMIHEFQHVKMGAVLDLYDLYDVADTRLFHAPWREDPRPLEGLLQGTYAHIGVSDFWRSRRAVGDGPHAEAQFERWRADTATAIETLAASRSLTALGTQFIDTMRDSMAVMLAEPVAVVRPGPAG
jgi:uncharacterized protein